MYEKEGREMRYRLGGIIVLIALFVLFCIGCSANNEKDEQVEKIGKNLKEPPNLTLAIGEQTIRTVIGSYSWNYIDVETGETINTQTDIAPSPELIDGEELTTVHTDAEVGLLFDYPPKEYSVKIWNEEKVIDTYEEIDLSLFQGKVLFELEGNWEQGTVNYVFALLID